MTILSLGLIDIAFLSGVLLVCVSIALKVSKPSAAITSKLKLNRLQLILLLNQSDSFDLTADESKIVSKYILLKKLFLIMFFVAVVLHFSVLIYLDV